ncbi:hypothetical protein L195_g027616 [Trifolium pratense]|uniref:Uncharacterized protein n=1 Tax=Trifolium pratense TaxID=57577 RepID=A0A2K3KZM6_TRIPR|nr:hypothetical protein L195_g027616 [Trifolium pratense]
MPPNKNAAAETPCTMSSNLRIMCKESMETAGRMAVMIWLLWNNRNQWLWNHEKKYATQLGWVYKPFICGKIGIEHNAVTTVQ